MVTVGSLFIACIGVLILAIVGTCLLAAHVLDKAIVGVAEATERLSGARHVRRR